MFTVCPKVDNWLRIRIRLRIRWLKWMKIMDKRLRKRIRCVRPSIPRAN